MWKEQPRLSVIMQWYEPGAWIGREEVEDGRAFRGSSARRGDWGWLAFRGDFDCKGMGVESMNHWKV